MTVFAKMNAVKNRKYSKTQKFFIESMLVLSSIFTHISATLSFTTIFYINKINYHQFFFETALINF